MFRDLSALCHGGGRRPATARLSASPIKRPIDDQGIKMRRGFGSIFKLETTLLAGATDAWGDLDDADLGNTGQAPLIGEGRQALPAAALK